MNQSTRRALTIVTIVGMVILVLILLGGTGMMGGSGGYGMMGGWGYRMGGWSGLPLVLTALIMAGLVLIGVWAVWAGRKTPHVEGRQPLDTLKERYARGEITREQYEQRHRDLE